MLTATNRFKFTKTVQKLVSPAAFISFSASNIQETTTHVCAGVDMLLMRFTLHKAGDSVWTENTADRCWNAVFL